jgi:hypothetical protein
LTSWTETLFKISPWEGLVSLSSLLREV